ncbi:MAG: type II secretion system F family protein [Clostridia bacterium]
MTFLVLYILIVFSVIAYSKKVIFNFPLCHCVFLKSTYKAFIPIARKVTGFISPDSKLYLIYPKESKEDISIANMSLKLNIFVLMLFLPVLAILFKASSITIALSVVGCFISPKCVDMDILTAYTKRKEEILIDFSVFLTKLTLCIGAGMSLYQALTQQEFKLPKRSFKEHADKLINNLSIHSDPENAFLELSMMLPITQINAFCSIMIAGFRNTEVGIKDTLKVYTSGIWSERRNNAKKRAEQSSAKAVLALAIGLIGILLVLTAPAMIMLMNI